ncbi:hypothetical protein FOMPIDRAFT_1023444 [Fomitopsis schrenkii]|uniref:RING-type domain-containing protein n=1 Tax=Fomitopsis schrenkii TaxID=2126942 RepID=S8FSF9_FOMSC|nr:hypothetical protein FOMPIDRAFT_1023444 [Fomitopsis schrenkii]
MKTRNIATRRPSAPRARASGSRKARSARVGRGRVRKPAVGKEDDESEAEESATEDVPTRASKRRKISDDVSEDTTPAQSVSAPPAPRRSSRRSEPTSKVAVDDDATSTPEPKRPSASARRRSIAACNVPTAVDKGEEKALQEEKRSLKRDRQAFEQETQRERAELNKRENKAEKRDSQLKSKLAAVKEKERDAKKRETECKKWEQTLKKREAEFAQREADLEERKKELQKKEQEIGDKALGVNMSRSDEAIDELDAKWQCALCFDVMACPYSLSPAQCGHTYCAVCILKWYFTNLCEACGDWCNHLDCPLCRTVLPRPVEPNERPRQMYALPFTPARAADERVTQLVDSLSGPVPESPTKASSSKRGKGKGKKKQVASTGGSDAEPSTPSTGWEYGGTLREEWQARSSRGRTEMRHLITQWPQMTAAQLRAFKVHICAPA